MLLSVIIVNYNVKYFLEQCIHSVLRSSIASDIEIIVVDNLSTDGSLEYLIPRFPNVKFIANDANLGFSKANNIGIKQAQGKYILLLNPDTVVGEHVLENCCRFMDENQQAGAIGVKMIDGSGVFLPESKRGFPTPWVAFCKIVRLNKLFPKSRLFGRYHVRFLDENKINEVDVLVGAFMLLRKTALDKSGLLDETFFMYGEDIDLSYRIKTAGYKNFYLPERILHYKGESAHANDARYIYLFYEAMYIFYHKHFRFYSFFYSVFVKFGIILSGSISLFRKYIAKIFRPIKMKIDNRKTHTFDVDKISYEKMLEEMDKNVDKNINYLIHNPSTGMTISASINK
jgi:GT2 family glycosyltransferase